MKDQPVQTYSQAAWTSAKETQAYLDAKKMNEADATLAAQKAAVAAPIASAAPAASPVPETTNGTVENPFLLSQLTKVGAKPGGSAAGAMYEDGNGQKWLVKSYNSPGQAANEVIASKMYQAMGVNVPEMHLIDLGDAHKGGIGVVSKWMDDVQPLKPGDGAHLKAAQEVFGPAALVADWDVVGLSFDNTLINGAGEAVVADPGGALIYRAMGTPKGKFFADTVGEIDTLRDPKMNPTGAKIFGKMTDSEMAKSMGDAANAYYQNKAVIDNAIDKYSTPDIDKVALKAKMEARAADMQAKSDQMQAALGTTSQIDIASTGTTSGSLRPRGPEGRLLGRRARAPRT